MPLACCAPASAAVPHVVARGETLWSIAAADGLSPAALAAANGLSPSAGVQAGAIIEVPAATAATTATLPAGAATTEPASDDATGDGTTGPGPLGGYVVRPGDTLSAIAATSGVSTSQLAWMNGLSPSAHVIAGTALKLATNSPTQPAQVGATPVAVTPAPPYPTAGRASSGQIETIAANAGVPGSLAAAIAWQESGFNNAAVSPANARGVMQVMPGTWDWVQQNLASSPLDPNSATDNVRAGVLYLRQLLRDTGGDQTAAVAAYYQGLRSVQSRGMLPSTRRYVNNVLALQGRFAP